MIGSDKNDNICFVCALLIYKKVKKILPKHNIQNYTTYVDWRI